jgi:hypothetical protein
MVYNLRRGIPEENRVNPVFFVGELSICVSMLLERRKGAIGGKALCRSKNTVLCRDKWGLGCIALLGGRHKKRKLRRINRRGTTT